MAKREVFHVVHKDDKLFNKDWSVKQAGTDFPLTQFTKKDDAVDYAVILAKSRPLGQVKIHGRDGKIQTEHTYNKDPRQYLG